MFSFNNNFHAVKLREFFYFMLQVDDEGNIRKNDIFENAAKLLIEVPEYLREDMKISPEFKKLFLSYIEKCEQLGIRIFLEMLLRSRS